MSQSTGSRRHGQRRSIGDRARGWRCSGEAASACSQKRISNSSTPASHYHHHHRPHPSAFPDTGSWRGLTIQVCAMGRMISPSTQSRPHPGICRSRNGSCQQLLLRISQGSMRQCIRDILNRHPRFCSVFVLGYRHATGVNLCQVWDRGLVVVVAVVVALDDVVAVAARIVLEEVE